MFLQVFGSERLYETQISEYWHVANEMQQCRFDDCSGTEVQDTPNVLFFKGSAGELTRFFLSVYAFCSMVLSDERARSNRTAVVRVSMRLANKQPPN